MSEAARILVIRREDDEERGEIVLTTEPVGEAPRQFVASVPLGGPARNIDQACEYLVMTANGAVYDAGEESFQAWRLER